MSVKKSATKVTVKKLSKPVVKKIAPKKVAKKIVWMNAQIREGYDDMKIQYRLPNQFRVSFYAEKNSKIVAAVEKLDKNLPSLAWSSAVYAPCKLAQKKDGLFCKIGKSEMKLETDHEIK